jgi:hypothetical protein
MAAVLPGSHAKDRKEKKSFTGFMAQGSKAVKYKQNRKKYL